MVPHPDVLLFPPLWFHSVLFKPLIEIALNNYYYYFLKINLFILFIFIFGCVEPRARTRVPCIGRWILNHCATREAPGFFFFLTYAIINKDILMTSCKLLGQNLAGHDSHLVLRCVRCQDRQFLMCCLNQSAQLPVVGFIIFILHVRFREVQQNKQSYIVTFGF